MMKIGKVSPQKSCRRKKEKHRNQTRHKSGLVVLLKLYEKAVHKRKTNAPSPFVEIMMTGK